MRVERGPNLIHMRPMGANRLVQFVAGYAKFLGPVSNVGRHLGVNYLRIVRTLRGVFFVDSVRVMRFRCIVVLRHSNFLSCKTLGSMKEWQVKMYPRAITLRREKPQ